MANIDIIALLDYIDRKRTNPNSNRNHHRNQKPFNPLKHNHNDIVTVLKKRKEENKLLEDYLKEITKPKEEKRSARLPTNIEWFIIGILAYPLIGPASKALGIQ